MLKNASIGQKLYLAGAVMACLLVALTTVSAVELRRGILHEVDQSLSDIIEIASTTMNSYQARVDSGEMSQPEAQAAAMRVLGDMRFEGDNYYFVFDLDHVMVMHAVRPDLNGQSMYGNKWSIWQRLR